MDGDLQNLEDSTMRHTHVNSALKDKLVSLKSQVSTLTADQDTLSRERTHLRDQVDQLALQSATAEERVRTEASARRALEDDLQQALDREDQTARELKTALERLRSRETDLAKLDDALRSTKTQSSDRVVQDLELDRLKRDLKRAERDADDAVDKAHQAASRLANVVS